MSNLKFVFRVSLYLWSLLLMASFDTQAQISDLLSTKHKSKIERVTSAKKKLKKYHKFYGKDSLKEAKAISKAWEKKFDSLTNLSTKSKVGTASPSEKKDSLYSEAPDFFPSKDSLFNDYLAYKKQVEQAQTDLDSLEEISFKDDLSFREYYKNSQTEYLSSKGLDNYGLPTSLDSINSKEVLNKEFLEDFSPVSLSEAGIQGGVKGSISEISSLSEQSTEADKLKSLPNDYKAKYEGLANRDSLKDISVQKGREFLHTNSELIEQAQSSVGLLKNKFSSVINSNDLSTATKANSLKGKPLGRRLWIGGNFQLSQLAPLGLFIDPSIGYRLNKKWTAGVGSKFEIVFGNTDTLSTNYEYRTSTFGYKLFSNYDFYKFFYAVIEFERNLTKVQKSGIVETNSWQEALLAGIGAKFHIRHGLVGSFSASYDFLYNKERTAYSGPLVFKFGFMIPGVGKLFQ